MDVALVQLLQHGLNLGIVLREGLPHLRRDARVMDQVAQALPGQIQVGIAPGRRPDAAPRSGSGRGSRHRLARPTGSDGIRIRAFLGGPGPTAPAGAWTWRAPSRAGVGLGRLRPWAAPRGMVTLDRDPHRTSPRCTGAGRLGGRTGLGLGAGRPRCQHRLGGLGLGLDPRPQIPRPARPRLRGIGPVGISPVRGLTRPNAGGKELRELAQGALEALAQAVQVKRRGIRPGLRGQRLSLWP